MTDLSVTLGRLRLRNPILVASGTFGYAREMAGVVDFARLGGIIPKTVTRQPRAGNPPPRTIETASGMLNAIGLDNDGIEHFLRHHLPYLRSLPTAIIGNIAGTTEDEFIEMAELVGREPGLAALAACAWQRDRRLEWSGDQATCFAPRLAGCWPCHHTRDRSRRHSDA